MVGWVGLALLAERRPPLVGLRRSTLRWPWREILVAAMGRLALPDEQAPGAAPAAVASRIRQLPLGQPEEPAFWADLQAVPAVALMRQTSREREATEEAVAP